jgi:hypothetical protein
MIFSLRGLVAASAGDLSDLVTRQFAYDFQPFRLHRRDTVSIKFTANVTPCTQAHVPTPFEN